jgi:pimeloyl-ACP methyl ester carboxylesterase
MLVDGTVVTYRWRVSETAQYAPKYVTANGIRFAYLEEGEGPLVLLMHGFPDTAHTWDDIRPKIAAKGYRAVSPFLRGYAPSEIPKHDTDQETLARDVLELITALGEKQAILIGHDWGATAVYGAAAIDPSRVSKLIALAIPHPATLKPSPKKLWGVRHFFAYKRSGAAKKFAANDFVALPLIYKRWSPAWSPADAEFADVKKCFSDLASCDAAFGYYRALRFSPPKFLRPRIAVPTIVFSGQHDPITDRNDYVRGQRMFTGDYTIEEMPGGHFLHREHPEIFAKQLLAHL